MPVYFIQASDGSVKIGRTTDVKRRLANLQTSHAYELKVIRIIDGGPVEEWECHHAFRDARIRGEWFEYRDAMLTFSPCGESKVSLLREQRHSRECRTDRDTLVGFVDEAIRRNPLKQKEIASLMGYRPSQLTRKVRQYDEDSSRLTIDDLELYLDATGDISPVIYLIEKYFIRKGDTAQLEEELARLKRLKGVA